MPKINPFAPNSPVNPGMFVGRIPELDRLEGCLLQARAGRPVSFMVTGERGIGKSSLLNYMKWVAEGSIAASGTRLNFLVIDTDIDAATTRRGLLEKMRLGLDDALAKTETARSFMKETWSFLQRIEAGGVKVKASERDEQDELLVEKFSYTLADLINRITSSEQSLFSATYDGILILIDEADNASKALGLGSLLKSLLERLQRRGSTRLVIGLAGLPSLRDVLFESHPSALRIFEEVPLDTLSDPEVSRVIDLCLADANKVNPKPTAIAGDARSFLVWLSEGYPHFIQQFGFSAFAADSNDVIEIADIEAGGFGHGGALERIGDRYYRNDFYNKIQSESYRRVLRIMADHGKEWITKDSIRAAFKGKESILTNAIKALVDRKIIIVKEGSLGVYRLHHRGFAWWIKLYTTDQEQLTLMIESSKDATANGGH
ncbi:MAG: ATP-binding protein [Gammaproteobacteria bacterium]|nr:MAG: ATP-binding protein [Gammaproteobacteria bacterium]